MANKKEIKATNTVFEKRKKWNIFLWLICLSPLATITFLLLFQSEDEMPPVAMLDNPPELLASVVICADGKTELGRYWKVNRTSVAYKDISPFVTDALIATEDERFEEHNGVDFWSTGRAVVYAGRAGGGSTITQQLAKLLFTLQRRERIEAARVTGEDQSSGSSSKLGRLMGRVNEKAQENIIATRLEKRYTKEEIITMYLNQFDFLYNAVGIENAAKVYFNVKPKDLKKEQAAMLIGMCKNPTLYNPYTFTIKNYRKYLANKKQVPLHEITEAEIAAKKSEDSLDAVTRRNTVLRQWMINSKKGNTSLRTQITKEEYDSLKMLPLVTNYQRVDHKRGSAPYFREGLRKELTDLLSTKNEDGSLKYKREDGAPYNIYSDGLRIYTTIDMNLQTHAEEALEKHLKGTLQPEFEKNNKGLKNWPFSNKITDDEVASIMRRARKISERYKSLKASGATDAEIKTSFNTPTPMNIFSWDGEIDTIMTPNDSIRYYKSILHAGLVSIEPQTGFVKAWVGGANIDHFAYDHVKTAKRQVGSTIKPFVYATALAMGVCKPCTKIPDIAHCVDLLDPNGNFDKKWCPHNSNKMSGEMVSMSRGLAMSMNNITVAVMAKMGGKAGPESIAKLLKDMDIELNPAEIVPAMCLGTMDLSLYQMVGAQCAIANHGLYNRPTTIMRIEDRNGNVIYNAAPMSKEVMSADVAYTTVKMMEGVVQGGTAGSLRGGHPWGGVTAPTAGKTGTTQNNSDGWFMGLTPELVTGVWVGAEDRSVRFKTMTWGQGGRMALPIYGYYMQKVYKDPKIGLSMGEFPVPEGYDPNKFKCDGEGQNLFNDKKNELDNLGL
jgi:penicillin-binding protein 1A